MLADADVWIRSGSDPLLTLEYHRHFTHSLFFVPFGAAVAFLLLWPLLRSRLSAGYLYRYCFLGYLLSGFIDACTSYGTYLFWPLSDERVAWSIISIVDPLFTGVLLVGVVVTSWRGRANFSRLALVIAAGYLLLATLQWQRAEQVVYQLAQQRDHRVEQMVIKPTFANILLWRSIYPSAGSFHIDVVRTGVRKKIYPGTSIAKFSLEDVMPEIGSTTVLYRDIQRFSYFSDGFLVRYPGKPNVLGDIRYAMDPASALPLWGIRLTPGQPEQHVFFENFRELSPTSRQRFLQMLKGD